MRSRPRSAIRDPLSALRVITACLALMLGGPAAAQQSVVDGGLWLKSTEGERRAFLIGITSTLGLEAAYARKHGNAPASATDATARAIEGMTLDQISSRITRWYHAHADRRHMPVMGVLWLDIVQPAEAERNKRETRDERP